MRNPIVIYAARSDMGRVRRNNEDNLFCCGKFMAGEVCGLPFKYSGKTNTPAVFAVCDGVGGHQFGETASLTAVQALCEFSQKIAAAPAGRLDELTREYVAEVNRQIRRASIVKAAQMGTTLALVVVLHDEIRAYNIGDSRIYTLDKSGFGRISEDHTLAMVKVKAGLLTPEQARESGDWNKLTACLGFPDCDGGDYKCEILPRMKLDRRVRILLCSDGLTDILSDDRIEQILRSNKSAEKAVLTLISEALNGGGTDNVTAVVADAGAGKLLRLIHAISGNTR